MTIFCLRFRSCIVIAERSNDLASKEVTFGDFGMRIEILKDELFKYGFLFCTLLHSLDAGLYLEHFRNFFLARVLSREISKMSLISRN